MIVNLYEVWFTVAIVVVVTIVAIICAIRNER